MPHCFMQKDLISRQLMTDTVDLGNVVRELYQIELPDKCRDVAGSIALHYNIEEIYNEEEQRLTGYQGETE